MIYNTGFNDDCNDFSGFPIRSNLGLNDIDRVPDFKAKTFYDPSPIDSFPKQATFYDPIKSEPIGAFRPDPVLQDHMTLGATPGQGIMRQMSPHNLNAMPFLPY